MYGQPAALHLSYDDDDDGARQWYHTVLWWEFWRVVLVVLVVVVAVILLLLPTGVGTVANYLSDVRALSNPLPFRSVSGP